MVLSKAAGTEGSVELAKCNSPSTFLMVNLGLKRGFHLRRQAIESDPIPTPRHGDHLQSVRLEPCAEGVDILLARSEPVGVLPGVSQR